MGPLTAVADQQFKCMSQFKALYLPNFCIKLNDKDSCVIIVDSVCLVKNIYIRDSHNTGHIVYNQFICKESFYSYPPITSDIVGTFKVNQLDCRLETCSVSEIKHKCLLMPYKNYFVAVTLLHTV